SCSPPFVPNLTLRHWLLSWAAEMHGTRYALPKAISTARRTPGTTPAAPNRGSSGERAEVLRQNWGRPTERFRPRAAGVAPNDETRDGVTNQCPTTRPVPGPNGIRDRS